MRYCLAVDLGSEVDPVAFSLTKYVERYQNEEHNYKRPGFTKENKRNIVSELHLSYMNNFPLMTPYMEIVKNISDIVFRPEFVDQIALVVDQNGVGLPVMQMMYNARLAPIGIYSHGGDIVNPSRRGMNVPKRDLVAALMAAYQMKRLKMPSPEKMPIIKVLEEQLHNFQMKINKRTGHDTYEAFAEKIHDDLVTSLAMNVWWQDKIHGMEPVVHGGPSHYPE